MRGTATGIAPAAKTHSMCYCDDCQTFAHYLERADDVLDANGGTGAFGLAPAQITIDQGVEQLRCVRLGPKGLYRWYAECCKTPVANTLAPSVPVVVLIRAFIDLDDAGVERAFGPVAARIMARFAHGTLPPDARDKAPLGFMLRVGVGVLGHWLTGKGHPSAFFDSAGHPRAPLRVLEKSERAALRARVPAPG
jgi:Family of unknown function (DUF6151)